MGTFRQEGQKLFWRHYNETLLIEPWGRDSLRVRATVNAGLRDDLFSALLPQPESSAQIMIGDAGASVVNGQLTASISNEGFLRFVRTESGEELLSEEPQLRATRRSARAFKAVQSDLFHLEARFRAYEDEHIYGLGQHQHGLLDQKGCTLDLIQRNTEITIPFLVSSRGYGFLWHNPAIGHVDLSKNVTRWVAEATPQLDYWVTTGVAPADILEHYADASGHPSEFPAWASGFWQCKLRYRTQEELLSVAREYKERGLPLSVVIIDFFNWTVQGDWRFDPSAWPDPATMVRELEAMGVKVMVSVWPTVNPLSENYRTMEERGLLLRTERGMAAFLPFQDTQPQGPVDLRFYDPTNPEARQFLWEKVQANYYTHGIHTFWLDACEPEMDPLDPDNLRFSLGNGQAIGNVYPLVHTRGLYENMQAAGEKAVLNLARSAWAGSQHYGVAIWSGDISSTFEALQAQVRAGLNMAMSGIPWWTTDTGGFYGADVESPYFRELIVRWFQYSTFCPIMRLHGYRNLTGDAATMRDTGGPNEVWSFGEEAYQIIQELLFLRERLRPYIQEQMRHAEQKGTPLMRPLFFDFQTDPASFAIDDQYLFGPDLLVAPVLTANTTQRAVYLPNGTTWTDAWTGEQLAGGQNIIADAPLTRIPLYLRGSARLPIQG
ncbi:MAG TPA: TIM-barrel domain-containing protein [Ktedonobacterales bacterium]|nr:TIM-barrel domain-containing protein [Ktedonobacterales bacterium]